MRSARWIRPGTYSRPAEPIPLTRPRLAPLLVTHVGPLGPSVTYGTRSRIAAEARDVNRSGGSQQRSTWQSPEITSCRMTGLLLAANGPSAAPDCRPLSNGSSRGLASLERDDDPRARGGKRTSGRQRAARRRRDGVPHGRRGRRSVCAPDPRRRDGEPPALDLVSAHHAGEPSRDGGRPDRPAVRLRQWDGKLIR